MMNDIIRFRYILSSYQMFTACRCRKKIYSLEFISEKIDGKNIISIFTTRSVQIDVTKVLYISDIYCTH